MINWKAERYEVVSSYPGSTYKMGDVVEKTPGWSEHAIFDHHPKIFRPLKWWECRLNDFTLLFTIKFCRITNTHGYWRNGDILPVAGYDTFTVSKNPTFKGFYLKGYSGNERYEVDRVEPATEEEFLKWKEKNKISITP